MATKPPVQEHRPDQRSTARLRVAPAVVLALVLAAVPFALAAVPLAAALLARVAALLARPTLALTAAFALAVLAVYRAR